MKNKEKYFVSCGIDVSTKLGISIIIRDKTLKGLESGFEIRADCYESNYRGHKLHAYHKKVISSVCKAYPPDTFVIEGYSFASKSKAFAQLIEMGANIRTLIYREFKTSYYNVPPTTLKKFVSCDGRADKQKMMFALAVEWNYETDNDNIADAVGLGLMGQFLANRNCPSCALSEKRIEALGAAELVKVT